MAQQAFEDAYLFVLDLDGDDCGAGNLRYTMAHTGKQPMDNHEMEWLARHSTRIDFRDKRQSRD